MNRNHLWKLVLIVGLLMWSFFEMSPPKSQPLVEFFRTHARVKGEDAPVFKGIMEKAQALDKEHPDQSFENLEQAVGTNDITDFFPQYGEAKTDQHPTIYILNKLQRDAAGKIKLGLDLQGGVAVLVRLDTNRTENVQGADTAISQAVEVLRKRVDKFGVAEPLIQPQGSDRILIQLPGLSHAQMAQAIETIKKVAYLEFRLVHPQNLELLRSGETIVPGYELLTKTRTAEDGTKTTERYFVKKRPELVGGIKMAQVTRDTMGRPEISFQLESKAADVFAKVTEQNIGHQLAIVLDKELQTAPSIHTAIPGGTGEITGDYSEQEAFALANVLENPLKTPLSIESSSEVDPTLGSDSIRGGIRAAIIGVIAVAVFMLVYYLAAGIVANAALMLNIIILLGVMCAIGTTLTLPGIAGVVLTIGMAVDANVLIYERIREELAAGKSMRGALAAGYDKAFSTIFDSNLTTLISSVILIFMGTGPVKGFGVTLTIGVTVSMFTALVVTRLIFDWLLAKNILKNLPMLHIIRGAKIDFMKWAVPAFVASWLLILIGNGYGIFGRGRDVLGVEFAGGDTVTLAFDQQHKESVDKLRSAATEASSGDVLVSYQRDLATQTDTLRVTVRSQSATNAVASEKVVDQLQKKFPEAKFRPLSVDHVGPTVGAEIAQTAVLASLLAMFGILVYVAFRYEFSFAVGAVVAIVHDILMTTGWYFLVGREMNATTVAALLTIIGFSINDTIVIFDRIREDLKLGVRGTFREVMNKALNQTLSRTIITSGTVFLATLSLYLFGGGVINDFAFTFLVGILTGTYSSIYIAAFIVLRWHKGQRPKIGNAQMSVEAAASTAK
jgi:SecD/SecF fusion protein